MNKERLLLLLVLSHLKIIGFIFCDRSSAFAFLVSVSSV